MGNVPPRPEKPLAVCEQCGSSFPRRDCTRNRFCGLACYHAFRHRSRQKACETCGGTFIAPYNSRGRFCSRECSQVHQRDRIETICETCGTGFFCKRSDGAHFCSADCHYASLRRPVEKVCLGCGRSYICSPSKAERPYCSLACFRQHSPPLICLACGETFRSRPGARPHFCSTACHNRYRAIRQESAAPCCVPGCTRGITNHKSQLCSKHYQYAQAHGSPEPPPASPLALSPTDAAWIAGILDGEGCLGVTRRPNGRHVAYAMRISVRNTCPRMIDRLYRTTGMGSLHFRPGDEKRRATVIWIVDRLAEVEALLLAVLPHLTTKSRQAELLLQWPRGGVTSPGERERLFLEARALNRRGVWIEQAPAEGQASEVRRLKSEPVE
jgi:hypothetical protein